MDLSQNDILNKIEDLSALSLRAEFENDRATSLMKRHAKYARQNGIHASPTFMINGLVDDSIGGRDSVATWLVAIRLQRSLNGVLYAAGTY